MTMEAEAKISFDAYHAPERTAPAALKSATRALAPRLSIVAPCYNEEGCVREFHRRASIAARKEVGDSFEIVLVNDGSKDRTGAILADMAKTLPNLVVVNLSRNFGHQRALSAGLMMCTGERVLIIDADLQDPPELLSDMMQIMEDGADVVYGQRRARAGETRFKTWSASTFYRFLHYMVDIDIPRDTGDFRLMSRRAVDVFKEMPEQFRFIRGLVSWIGFTQRALVYDRAARLAGETNYPLTKMIRFALDAVTSFSIIPLRIASFLGLLGGALGLVMLIYTLTIWLLGAAVVGWTSIVSIILIVSSIQLVVLGIMGEYLGRLYLESKARPLFVVESVLSSTESTMQ